LLKKPSKEDILRHLDSGTDLRQSFDKHNQLSATMLIKNDSKEVLTRRNRGAASKEAGDLYQEISFIDAQLRGT